MVQIEGQYGTHYFSGLVFSQSVAKSGGAVSVNGSVDSITIDSCYFNFCFALLNGGGIFFSDESN